MRPPEHPNSARHMTLLKRVGTSLWGHVLFYQVVFSVPIAVTFLYLNYSDGTLTAAWAGHIAIVSVVSGVTLALGFWYAITLPRLRRRGSELQR